MQERELDLKGETNKLLAGIKQQDADTRLQRAQSYDESIDKRMSEDDKLAMQARAALDLERERQSGRMGLEGTRQEGRESLVGVRGDDSRLTQTQRDAAAMARVQESGNQARQTNAVRPQTPQSETQEAQGIANKAAELVARDPSLAKVLQFDEKGNFIGLAPESQASGGGLFGAGADDGNVELRRRAASALYGDQQPLTPGLGSAGLGGRPAQGIPITGSINQGKGADSRPVDPKSFDASVGQVRRQRNAATGEIRESTDGGKTWKIVGR
jgi:hypothetical protein